MNYTLRQLQVFLATAYYQNISKAANKLALSQPAASSALSELESQYGIQLFDRIGKRLQLNSLGYALRPQAEALLQQAEELDISLRQHTASGHLKVGATLTIGNYIAIHVMSRFLETYPSANIELDVANTSRITEKVCNFELDIGLIEGELSNQELDIIPWIEDELIVFCSPNHPYATKQVLTYTDITQAKWILREPGSGTRQTFDRSMYELLPEIQILLELQHTEAIKRAVESGLGIGCLSKLALHDAFSRKSLVPLSLPNKRFHRHFYFIIHKKKYRNAGVTNWLKLCRSLY